MTLRDKVWALAWILVAGGAAALLYMAIASLVSPTSPIHLIAIGGSVVFGLLVAYGFARFFNILAQEIADHHAKHQDYLFVHERDRIIDRTGSRTAVPTIRIIPAPPVMPEEAELTDFDPAVQQMFPNGGNAHES